MLPRSGQFFEIGFSGRSVFVSLIFFRRGFLVCSWIGNLPVGHDSRLYVCLFFLFLFGFILTTREYLFVFVFGSFFLLSMFFWMSQKLPLFLKLRSVWFFSWHSLEVHVLCSGFSFFRTFWFETRIADRVGFQWFFPVLL